MAARIHGLISLILAGSDVAHECRLVPILLALAGRNLAGKYWRTPTSTASFSGCLSSKTFVINNINGLFGIGIKKLRTLPGLALNSPWHLQRISEFSSFS